VAIPKITDEFHSIKDVGWYASSYKLTSPAFMLLFGKIMPFTRQNGFCWSASGQIATQQILPLQKRPAVMGMMGAIFGTSSVAGPLIGGALTDKATWR